jgi:hypothetical protein
MLYFLLMAEMWEKISFNKRVETRDWESNWMLEPNRGTNLPFRESVTISVYVDAPDEQATLTGSIKIWNTENHADYGIVSIQLVTTVEQLSLQWNFFP